MAKIKLVLSERAEKTRGRPGDEKAVHADHQREVIARTVKTARDAIVET